MQALEEIYADLGQGVSVGSLLPRLARIIHYIKSLTTDISAINPIPTPVLRGYTCGWCHKRVPDLGHVKKCRLEQEAREEQKFARVGEALLDLERQLMNPTEVDPQYELYLKLKKKFDRP